MDSRLISLIYNGEYYGVYELSEHVRVDSTRIDIFDWEEALEDGVSEKDLPDYTGGVLMEMDENGDYIINKKGTIQGNYDNAISNYYTFTKTIETSVTNGTEALDRRVVGAVVAVVSFLALSFGGYRYVSHKKASRI